MNICFFWSIGGNTTKTFINTTGNITIENISGILYIDGTSFGSIPDVTATDWTRAIGYYADGAGTGIYPDWTGDVTISYLEVNGIIYNMETLTASDGSDSIVLVDGARSYATSIGSWTIEEILSDYNYIFTSDGNVYRDGVLYDTFTLSNTELILSNTLLNGDTISGTRLDTIVYDRVLTSGEIATRIP